MYLGTLSITGENILAFVLNNLEQDYSIREIAQAIKQDYKIVFTTVQKLKEQKVITIKRVSNINRCTPNLNHENAQLFSFISQRHTAKKLSKTIRTALQDIITSIKNPFYTLLVFGSYAKGTSTPKSDIDVLFITSDKNIEPQINASVKKSATLNNLQINHIILTREEFKNALKEPSVATEAYKTHFIIHGGEQFYEMTTNA
ncbi:nucleotidyltransferase domain-containing protein [Candidatus Woesearchaeota archaeon]|nr:nucleotidyltransferase domain-containing protein [Candidatus Woesearchaeota archaeon]